MLGVLPGIMGTIQAMETIKLILGAGEPLVGRLLLFDALAMHFRELRLRKNPACSFCGERRTINALSDYEEFCGIRGEETAPVTTGIPEITPRELKARLAKGDDLFILDVREPHEFQICNWNGHLIPLGDLPRRVSELDSSREIGGASAPQRQALRGCRRVFASGGFQKDLEFEGRHSSLVG